MKKSYKEVYDKFDGNKCRCNIFKTRYNDEDKLYSVIYGRVASQAISPIEKKPMYHFYPGFLWLSVGSVGCDFYCPGCQNFDLTFVDVMNEKNISMIYINYKYYMKQSAIRLYTPVKRPITIII